MFRTGSIFLDGRHVAVRIHMAAARTVPEFTDAVACVGVFMFLVWIRFEIICMTRGTIRYIGRPCHCLAVGFVTGGAEKIASVVSWIQR